MKDVPVLSEIEQVLAEWIPPAASVALAVEEQYVRYKPGEWDIRLKPGDPVRTGSVAAHVLQSGRRVETDVDERVYGLPYHGKGYPLHAPEGRRAALVVILPQRYPRVVSPRRVIVGRDGEVWRPIPVEDIAWFESYDKRTWLYTPHGKFTTIYTLSALEAQLPEGMFLRIHRSFLVNIHWIHAISRDIHGALLVEIRHPFGQRLPVAHGCTRRVREVLGF
ncbi:MAG: LytTR family transcriptional regulator [Alicyclobacillus macrosporangiidus]|uniref:LytR/AlgR family response regulator transcription factor n=1 Tax=Alicyclobacillus macrosporangiidus TaxID=392015 RepID=UPI0026EE59FC|nr:LytTR family DNA-binding domain-containing protein [Alicyclobacillus macrosporangiidus]MCL6600117.1 LytTR family transcriptional regulator [Alicyclobacillus macrosporangiidus]